MQFRNVEVITNTTIKTAKAYSSVWVNNARYKELNINDVAKKELEKEEFEHLVLAAPTVDISNLSTENVKATDNTDVFSCQNMLKIAEDALATNPGLTKVTLMNHTPRYDLHSVDPMGLKPNLASFANSYMLELWLDSKQKNHIFIGSHSLESSSSETRKMIYTDEKSGRYDGVHPYGCAGRKAYTESALNILLTSFQSKIPSLSSRQSTYRENHFACPQTNYMYSKQEDGRRKYSSVVSGQPPIKTQNRFSPLNNGSKN